ncbi:Uncharacterised protein [Streptococcus pneumoniae]|nr:Uncharacterised protein [Streptococcus pneumoniae]
MNDLGFSFGITTNNLYQQVIFLAVILVLFTSLGMLAYQHKKMEED